MRGGSSSLAAGMIILLLLTATLVPLSVARSIPPTLVSTVHDPILIDGDANFTAANGVVGGAGTASDPYRIEGWTIAAMASNGIELLGTTAHVLLRNLTVQGADIGVELRGATNVVLDNVTAGTSSEGIQVVSSANVTVRGSDGSSNADCGIAVIDATNVLLERNSAMDDFEGLCVIGSLDVTLDRNHVERAVRGIVISGGQVVDLVGNLVANETQGWTLPIGIYLLNSDGAVLTDNVVTSIPQSALKVENSTGIVLTGNTFADSGVGAELFDSTGSITRNRFYDNLIQSFDAYGTPWDAGYPAGGNYWSDYWGVGRCRGPTQTDCAAPDGIGDTPYAPNGTVRDRYPLMIPNLPPSVRIVASATDVLVGSLVQFRASVLISGGTVASIAWDFGDGSTAEGASADHIYTSVGNFTLELLVTDNRNLSGDASQVITVWPSVTFVMTRHSSGFQLPTPADWETHTDYKADGETLPVASLGPDVDTFRTNVLVTYADDSSAQESAVYLASGVDGILDGVRQDHPDAHLSGEPIYLTVSGHAAVAFTIAYSSTLYVQRIVLVVSSAHNREWLLLLTVAPSAYRKTNAIFAEMVAGFSITALSTSAVGLIVGGLIGGTVFAIVLVVVRLRKRRASRTPPHAGSRPFPPEAPAVVTAAFCVQCGIPLRGGERFCGRCGAPVWTGGKPRSEPPGGGGAAGRPPSP